MGIQECGKETGGVEKSILRFYGGNVGGCEALEKMRCVTAMEDDESAVFEVGEA